ncbi:uncharacterized protein LOC127253525 isoform X2 [Andrographis paniculata]|uniref:uncharacterized protein LOC127253525 isoform X2 n=1 Tax=Andrographis paniculata TaxID=175694 RepID=UPI0021E7D5D1|nr:uncharacterized protein LOC127253525 isoform X2 [Andrographis paniculata]
MEKAREFLEKKAADDGYGVADLIIPPHKPHAESTFYEYFLTKGIKVDRLDSDSIFCSFTVPPRLTDSDGNFAAGAIASIIDEVGSAAIHEPGQPMDLSVDTSISYLSPAKDELEIISRRLGRLGSYAAASVTLRNKQTGEIVAEGRHSYFSRRLPSKL